MKEKSEAQKAEDLRDIKAFKIAKAICEISMTFGEALYITEKAVNIIKRQRDMKKPDAGEYPVDRYGQRVETPDADASGLESDCRALAKKTIQETKRISDEMNKLVVIR